MDRKAWWRWYRPLWQAAPVLAAAGVLASWAAQLALLVAVLLPLRFIVAMADAGLWSSGGLLLGAVLAYGIHLAADRAFDGLCQRVAAAVGHLARPLATARPPDAVLVNDVRRLLLLAGATSMASGVAVLLLVMYPWVGALFVAWPLAWPWISARAPRRDLRSRRRLLGSYVMAGVFVCLGLMLLDAYRHSLPALVTLASVLLAYRQGAAQVVMALWLAETLTRERRRIDHRLVPGPGRVQRQPLPLTISDWMQPDQREQRLRKVLEPHGLGTGVPLRIAQRVGGGGHLLELYVAPEQAQTSQGWLVKVHDPARESLARHAADLLMRFPSGLPTFPWLGESTSWGAGCHVYRWSPQWQRLTGAPHAAACRSLRARLLALQPAPEVLQWVAHTEGTWRDRLTDIDWVEFFQALDDPWSGPLIRDMAAAWPEIAAQLVGLPSQIALPGLAGLSVFSDGDGMPCLHQWHGWRVGPCGAGWSLSKGLQRELEAALPQAQITRPELQGVTAQAMTLAALAHEWERRLSARQFQTAADLIPEMLLLIR